MMEKPLRFGAAGGLPGCLELFLSKNQAKGGMTLVGEEELRQVVSHEIGLACIA
jgi:hypothetical protein